MHYELHQFRMVTHTYHKPGKMYAFNTVFGLNQNNLTSHCFSLSRHLDFFEMVRNEDDSELAKRFDMVSNAPLAPVYFVVKL